MSKSNIANRGSYSHIFIYRISNENHAAMISLQKQLTQLYRKHGTLSSEFYQLVNTNVFEGFTGLGKVVDAKPDEEVWVEVDTYQDAEQFKKVVEAVGGDKTSDPLFGQLYTLVSKGYSVVMGEFSRLWV